MTFLRMLSKLRCVLCLVVLLLPSLADAASDRQPHILLISVDTLRADRMGSYGYPRKTSPHIDALLAGEPVATPKTRAHGCSTKWADKREAAKKYNEEFEKKEVTISIVGKNENWFVD